MVHILCYDCRKWAEYDRKLLKREDYTGINGEGTRVYGTV